MKKFFTIAAVVAGMLICGSAFAQEVVAAENENQAEVTVQKPYKVYCEIRGTRLLFSEKMNVDFDFGQFSSWWSVNRRLADEDGKAINFNSMLDAANYMARRGWELEEAFVDPRVSNGSSTDSYYHWIMSKMVTCDEEITEGLQTVGMKKGK